MKSVHLEVKWETSWFTHLAYNLMDINLPKGDSSGESIEVDSDSDGGQNEPENTEGLNEE
jgi:hypothetical protein